MESATVNLRSKRTATENSTIVALWKVRCEKVSIRKKYENEIEHENDNLRKEILAMISPIASNLQTPIEIIIESNRCVIQKKIFYTTKAKNSSFITTLSVDIPSISTYMLDEKRINEFPSVIKKAIRRLNKITKNHLGKPVHPLITSPQNHITDLKRMPNGSMVTVTYNVRTRYDF